MKDYGLYIDGKDVPGAGVAHVLPARAYLDDVMGAVRLKRRLDRRGEVGPEDPVLARCATADVEQIAAAAAAARRAFPAWRRVPFERRLELVRRVHDELTRRGGEIVELLVEEGHPHAFAEIEVAGMIESTGEASQALYRDLMSWDVPSSSGRRLRFLRKPDGVVAINPPQNAALINASVAVLALLAGNTVVVRAPQSNPVGVYFLGHEILAPILEDMGAPPGTFNVISAQTALTLRNWIGSEDVDDIFYFGDSARGMALARECVAVNKKPILELAGNDVVVVWRDADPAYAAWALTENFIGSGQFCLVPKLAVVHPDIADAVLAELVEIARRTRPGYPDEPGVWLTPVRKSEEFFEVLADSVERGGEVLTGGCRWDVDGEPDEAGIFIAPTVVRIDGLDAAAEHRAVREETFFPLLPVVVPTSADDDLLGRIVDFIEDNPYGLRNSLWATDPEIIDRFVDELGNGGLLKVNDSHVGFALPLASHGGTGLSGGPFGGANLPIVTTTHLQGVAVGTGEDPRRALWPAGFGHRPWIGSADEE